MKGVYLMDSVKKVVVILIMFLILISFSSEVFAQLEEKDELYVGVYSFTDLENWVDHKLGLEAAGKMLGVKTRFVGPPDHDIIQMVNDIEQAIAENAAGIIVFGPKNH